MPTWIRRTRAAGLPKALLGDPAARPALLFAPVAEPRVSIVIPVFNELERTIVCLASILERSGDVPYEVLVVDDASTDETRELEERVRGLRVLRLEANQGFIGACNHGAAQARGEFLVFLNNDTLVSEGWLSPLLAPFADAEIGLVGAKLVYPDGRLQEAGGILFSDGSGWNYGRGDDPSKPKYEFLCDAHYCSGACIALRRETFQMLGAFDTRFAPMYYEDVDLAFAVRAAGLRVVCNPACVIVHAEGGTAGSDPGSGAKRYQTLNRAKFVEKWQQVLASHPPAGSNPDVARYLPNGPHVLVIDSYTPRVDHDAGSVRMVHLFRILRRLGCRVSFIPENRAREGEYTSHLQALGVEALYHPHLPSIAEHLARHGGRYDCVLMSRVDVAAEVLDDVRRHCPRALRVFDTVDLHFLREARRAQATGELELSRAEGLKSRELDVARACDLTLVVSRTERELLAELAPEVRVELLSLILSPDRTDTAFADRNGVLFIGNFQHPPNCDALEEYLEKIHPAVRERLPDAPFLVIGAHVPKRLSRMGGDGVEFLGQVSDIRALFARVRLSVAPLRYGAGIKGKIISSLGYGVPVVTTAIGAEGIDLVDGRDVLIAEEPAAFAAAVATLHSDEELWSRLAENGLGVMTDQFSIERAERSLARWLESASPAAALRRPELG